MNSKTSNTIAIIAAAIVAILLPLVPIINILDFPFRLLVTIVHELGHGLAAIFTGGSFRNFTVAANGSGLAYTTGGWRWVVIPAGYLSEAIFSAVLFRLGGNLKASRWALGIIGGAMIVLSLWFGRPGGFSIQAIAGSVLGMIFGVIFGALFLKLALQAGSTLITFFLHFIAIKAGLATFSDLFVVIGLSLQRGNVPHTDAHAMAELTHIPPIIWALLWAIIALMFIAWAVLGRLRKSEIGFEKSRFTGYNIGSK